MNQIKALKFISWAIGDISEGNIVAGIKELEWAIEELKINRTKCVFCGCDGPELRIKDLWTCDICIAAMHLNAIDQQARQHDTKMP